MLRKVFEIDAEGRAIRSVMVRRDADTAWEALWRWSGEAMNSGELDADGYYWLQEEGQVPAIILVEQVSGRRFASGLAKAGSFHPDRVRWE